MNPRIRRLTMALLGGGALLAAILFLLMSEPGPPVAHIRVVDAAGKPVAGAVVRPDGLRPKSGPYEGGHYGWPQGPSRVPDDPVTTDETGVARVHYPKYVFERIETGQISFSVDHPEFVPDRPFRVVATVPPAGAPLKAWFDYGLNRLQLKNLIARTDPVVLQNGAVLKITLRNGSDLPANATLFAQTSALRAEDAATWSRPEAGVLITRRMPPGPGTVRAVALMPDGSAWFGEVKDLVAKSGETNEVSVVVKRGVTVRGRLEESVPRPVTGGRVIAHVWPTGRPAQSSPPTWHAWSTIREDGTFEIASLPEGDLEVVSICRGFISVPGPGKHAFRYPQKHSLGTNDIEITMAMEPTARLEVTVLDEQGRPVEGARISTWPNVRYGEWAAVIFASDCYITSDWLLGKRSTPRWFQSVPEFEGTSDRSGIAVLPGLPSDVTSFSLVHTQYALPIVKGTGGEQHRMGQVSLSQGRTNRITVRVEAADRSIIRHY